MDICGIVAEYNPFHNGHKLHIDETRNRFGNDVGIVCVMSGNCVQRGDFAIFPKHTRAEMAVKNGADLVLELPSPWALSSAERFASGSISILNCLGCITHLSFGSECGNIAELKDVVNVLTSSAINELIKKNLTDGNSYAVSRNLAYNEITGQSSSPLFNPNDILGIEYIKALEKLGSTICPISIKRTGANHDEALASSNIASASFIRDNLYQGNPISQYIPTNLDQCYSISPVSIFNSEKSVLALLRSLPDEAFDNLPDNSEGLSKRFMKYARDSVSIIEIYNGVKTKRYPLSRIRRMLMCAYLGIDKQYSQSLPPYARVLAANQKGLDILGIIKKTSSIPIIIKPASVRKLDEKCIKLFNLESHITDMYNLNYTTPIKSGIEWTISPKII